MVNIYPLPFLLFKHPEAEFKEKRGVWDPRLELRQISSYLRVESKVSFLPLIIIKGTVARDGFLS
jgi:hypothetical protein